MFDLLRFYVVAAGGFSARFRLNSIVTNDQRLTEHERELIRRDMNDFCRGHGDLAAMPTSLFYSLTELCTSIDMDEIIVSSFGNPWVPSSGEAKWTKINEYLRRQGEQAVNFDNHRETICRFIWCHLQRELVAPNLSPPSRYSAPAPTPEPLHAEFSAAPIPRVNIPRMNGTHRASVEGYKS